MILKSAAIVLNSHRFGDTSKIVSVFTRELGKLSLIAKGAMQHKSKFSGSLEPLNLINISYYHKQNKDLLLLSDSEISLNMHKLVNSLEHYSAGLMMIESISQTQENLHPNAIVYDELTKYLIYLNQLIATPFSLFVKFHFYLADSLGFGCNFFDKIEVSDYISYNLNDGMVTPGNYPNSKTFFRFDKEMYNQLVDINNYDISFELGMNFSKPDKMQIINFFCSYFSYHLDKKYNFKSSFLI